MSSKTKIEWHTKTAAARIGISAGEYVRLCNEGKKRCTDCKFWKMQKEFSNDRSRGDGKASRCGSCSKKRHLSSYEPRPGPESGRRFVEARDGDRKQARRRVNFLVESGLIPNPNTLPCSDCGLTHKDHGKRHEYDHHNGYAASHHEDVEAVCSGCHHAREAARGS